MTVQPFVAPLHWALRHSPNQSVRSVPVDCIVLHADASSNIATTIEWCGRATSKVSYHIVIGRNGAVYQLVPPGRVAWHAGDSAFKGRKWCNHYSVGVCLSNKNDGIEPFTQSQMVAAEQVCRLLMQHYKIPADRITTHADVALPKGRKTDPRGLDLYGFRIRVARGLGQPAAADDGQDAGQETAQDDMQDDTQDTTQHTPPSTDGD